MQFVKNNGFMFLLAAAFFLSAAYFSFAGSEQGDYYKVSVAKGDSLWSLAQEYSSLHSLTEEEFIQWVQDQNGLFTTKIQAGDQLVIPVPASSLDQGIQLADGK